MIILPITTKPVKKHKKYSTLVRAANFRIYIVMSEVALSNFQSIFTKVNLIIFDGKIIKVVFDSKFFFCFTFSWVGIEI
jgi:hypothetical protein